MAATFFSRKDLLWSLSDVINNRKTLYRLCFVNKTLYDIFSKKLHRTLDLKDINFLPTPERIGTLFNFVKLDSTRDIFISSSCSRPDKDEIFECDFLENEYNSEMDIEEQAISRLDAKDLAWSEANKCVAGIISRCPNLRSFSAAGILLKRQTLEQLSVAPNLRQLSINMYLEFDIPPSLDDHRIIELQMEDVYTFWPKFRHLHSVSLLGISGCLGAWQQSIVELLVNNPGLEHLRLSIRLYSIAILGVVDALSPPVFFNGICTCYPKKTKHRLRLITLELWGFIDFPHLKTLSAVTEVERLESIGISRISLAPNALGEHDGMDWNILHPDNTPKLRKLYLEHLFNEGYKELMKLACCTGRRIDDFLFLQGCVSSPDHSYKTSYIADLTEAFRSRTVMLPPNFSYQDVDRVANCTWLTKLFVSTKDDSNPLSPEVEDCILGLPNLEAIFVQVCYNCWTHEPFDGYESLLHWLGSTCPTLKYVGVQGSTRVIRRQYEENQVVSTFEQLEVWEGEELFGVCEHFVDSYY